MKLIWLGVGNNDFLYKMACDFGDVLSKHRINHTFFVSSGGHTWMNANSTCTKLFSVYFKLQNINFYHL